MREKSEGPSSSHSGQRTRRTSPIASSSSSTSTSPLLLPELDSSLSTPRSSSIPGQARSSINSSAISTTDVEGLIGRVVSPHYTTSFQTIDPVDLGPLVLATFDSDLTSAPFSLDNYWIGSASTPYDFSLPMNQNPDPASTPPITSTITRPFSPTIVAPRPCLPPPASSINQPLHSPNPTLPHRTWQTQRGLSHSPIPSKRTFECPVRQAEIDRGALVFSCRASAFDTMADLRRHIERARHVSFLKLCPTCNEHVIDKTVFEHDHGIKGEKCINPQKQARGAEAMQAQWWQLYELINSQSRSEPESISEVSMVDSNPAPSRINNTEDEQQNHSSRSYRRPDNLIVESGLDNANPSAATVVTSLPLFASSTRPNPQYYNSYPLAYVRYPAIPLLSSGVGGELSISARPRADGLTYSPQFESSSAIAQVDISKPLEEPLNQGLTGSWSPTNFELRRSISPSPSPPLESSDPIFCSICNTAYSGEYRKGNLARHRRQKHGDEEQLYPCEESYCSQIFKRQDARLNHYRKEHQWRAPHPPLPRRFEPSVTGSGDTTIVSGSSPVTPSHHRTNGNPHMRTIDLLSISQHYMIPYMTASAQSGVKGVFNSHTNHSTNLLGTPDQSFYEQITRLITMPPNPTEQLGSTLSKEATESFESVGVQYLFRIDEIVPSPNAPPRYDKHGMWNPPLELGASERRFGVGATGVWWYCRGQQIQRIVQQTPPPGSSHFQTCSVYFCEGFGFRVLRGDATQPAANEAWRPLSFGHDHVDYSSYLTNAGSERTLRYQRFGQIWPQMLFPVNNQVTAAQTSSRYGGLKGDLSIFLALIAFSMGSQHLMYMLPHMLSKGAWAVHQHQHGRIHQRGVVVYVYTSPPNWDDSDAAKLHQYQNGVYGNYYP